MRYSDPTANTAISNVHREWMELSELAQRIRESGDSEWAERERRRFRGVFARLLEDPTPERRHIA